MLPIVTAGRARLLWQPCRIASFSVQKAVKLTLIFVTVLLTAGHQAILTCSMPSKSRPCLALHAAAAAAPVCTASLCYTEAEAELHRLLCPFTLGLLPSAHRPPRFHLPPHHRCCPPLPRHQSSPCGCSAHPANQPSNQSQLYGLHTGS